MNLNLSDYKKIEAGDKHTTLEHSSGNRIKIAHQGLSKDFRKKLEELPVNMAKGGYAKYAQQYDPNMGSKASKPSKSSSKMPGSQQAASMAYTEPKDMGTDIPKAQLESELNDKQFPDVVVSSLNRNAPPFGPLSSDSSQHYPPCINASCKSFGKSHPHCTCYGGNSEKGGAGEAGYFAEGGEVKKEYYCDNDRAHFKKCEYFKDGGEATDSSSDSDKLNQAAQQFSQEVPPVETQDSQQNSTPAPSPLPAPVGVNQEMQGNQPDQTMTPDPAQQMDQQSQDQTQRAPTSDDGTGVTEMPPAEQFQKYKSDHMQQILNESGQFNNELDQGQITPKHYFHLFGREGTLGKIGASFGLMLSGIGSGLTHQPNAALEIMQNEINNDLKAQELSTTNKQNFLKINQQGLMNQAQEAQMGTETKTKAYALAKMQMNYAALHSLVQNASKLPPGSPQRQQADQQLAMLNQGVQNENFNIADRAATAAALGQYLSGGNGSGGKTQMMKSGIMGPEAAEVGNDIEQKTYPGLGKSTLPLSASDREQLDSGLTFQRSLGNFMDFTKTHSGDLSPSDIKYGRALAAQLQGQYRKVTHGGVYKTGEQDFINKIINDNPTAFFNKVRNLPSLQAVKTDSANQFDQLVKGKGFPGYQGAGGSQTQAGQGGAPMAKSGREMIQKNGKWYYK